MMVRRSLYSILACIFLAAPLAAQMNAVPDPAPANLSGTVLDSENDVVSGAQIQLAGPGFSTPRTAVADDNGGFHFDQLAAGSSYRITINASGYVPWISPDLTLNPGQFVFLNNVRLVFSGGVTSITVSAAPEQVATEEVKLEEQQRVLGFVPNFYVTYDADPAPLTTRLKFSLALKAETDPVTFLGAALIAGMDQGGGTPSYAGGAAGYGQRFGANYTTGFTDIMFGGAILPSLLHQDPRYYYKGTGTTHSRVLHALATPFVAHGDNGKLQPNYSSIGGDLIAGSISESYFPANDRGPGLVFGNALIAAGGRAANGLVQEFVLRKLTPGPGNRGQ